MDEVDDLGVPIKKAQAKQVDAPQVDELGVPIRVKSTPEQPIPTATVADGGEGAIVPNKKQPNDVLLQRMVTDFNKPNSKYSEDINGVQNSNADRNKESYFKTLGTQGYDVTDLKKKYNQFNELDKIGGALKESPDDLNLLHRTGRLQFLLGKNDDAIKTYEKMIDLNPDDPSAYVGLANIAHSKGDETSTGELMAQAYARGLGELPQGEEANSNINQQDTQISQSQYGFSGKQGQSVQAGQLVSNTQPTEQSQYLGRIADVIESPLKSTTNYITEVLATPVYESVKAGLEKLGSIKGKYEAKLSPDGKLVETKEGADNPVKMAAKALRGVGETMIGAGMATLPGMAFNSIVDVIHKVPGGDKVTAFAMQPITTIAHGIADATDTKIPETADDVMFSLDMALVILTGGIIHGKIKARKDAKFDKAWLEKTLRDSPPELIEAAKQKAEARKKEYEGNQEDYYNSIIQDWRDVTHESDDVLHQQQIEEFSKKHPVDIDNHPEVKAIKEDIANHPELETVLTPELENVTAQLEADHANEIATKTLEEQNKAEAADITNQINDLVTAQKGLKSEAGKASMQIGIDALQEKLKQLQPEEQAAPTPPAEMESEVKQETPVTDEKAKAEGLLNEAPQTTGEGSEAAQVELNSGTPEPVSEPSLKETTKADESKPEQSVGSPHPEADKGTNGTGVQGAEPSGKSVQPKPAKTEGEKTKEKKVVRSKPAKSDKPSISKIKSKVIAKAPEAKLSAKKEGVSLKVQKDDLLNQIQKAIDVVLGNGKEEHEKLLAHVKENKINKSVINGANLQHYVDDTTPQKLKDAGFEVVKNEKGINQVRFDVEGDGTFNLEIGGLDIAHEEITKYWSVNEKPQPKIEGQTQNRLPKQKAIGKYDTLAEAEQSKQDALDNLENAKKIGKKDAIDFWKKQAELESEQYKDAKSSNEAQKEQIAEIEKDIKKGVFDSDYQVERILKLPELKESVANFEGKEYTPEKPDFKLAIDKLKAVHDKLNTEHNKGVAPYLKKDGGIKSSLPVALKLRFEREVSKLSDIKTRLEDLRKEANISELTPLEAAKANLNKAAAAKDAAYRSSGFDPFEAAKRKAEADRIYHEAILIAIKEFIKEGVKTAIEFAEKANIKLTDAIQKAWDEATAKDGGEKPKFDTVEEERKYIAENPDSGWSSAKNEVIEARRKALGLDPILKDVRITDEKLFNDTADILSKEGEADNLVNTALESKRYTFTAPEQLAVLHERSNIEEQLVDLAKEKLDGKDVEGKRVALQIKLNQYDQVLSNIGTYWSELGKARQQYINKELTQAKILKVMQSYNKDGVLPDDVKKQIEGLFKERDEAKAATKVAEENLATKQKELQDLKDQVEADKIKADIEAKKKANTANYKKAKAAGDFIRQFKTKPFELKDENGNVIDIFKNSPVDWNGIVEGVAKAVETAVQKGLDIKDAIHEAIKDAKWFGDLTDKGKEAVLKQFQDQFTPKEKVKTKDEATGISHQLLRDAVEAGNTDINDIVKYVKEQTGSEATDREVRDAITKYGKTLETNKEPIEATIRKAKRIGRTISALEDVRAKKRPLRSGLQRDKLEVDEKRLLKELREAMEDLPIEDADLEKQLKVSLDGIKTRIENSIEDLQKQLDTNDFPEYEKKKTEYDAEAKLLKQQQDKLQAEVDQRKEKLGLIPSKKLPKTPVDPVIRNLENSIEDLQKQLDDGRQKFEEKQTEAKSGVAKILQEQVDDLNEIHKSVFGSDKLTPEEKIQRSIDGTEKAINKVKDKIEKNDLELSKNKKETDPYKLAVRERLKRANDILTGLREDAGIMEKKRLESAKVATERRIKEKTAALKSGDVERILPKTKNKNVELKTEENKKLAKELDEAKQREKKVNRAILDAREEYRLANRSSLERFGDFMNGLAREGAISNPLAIPKIFSSGMMTQIVRPIENIIGVADIYTLPKVVRENATIEGKFNLKTELKAQQQFITGSAWKDAWNKMKTGSHREDVLYSQKHYPEQYVNIKNPINGKTYKINIHLSGRMHAFSKTVPYKVGYERGRLYAYQDAILNHPEYFDEHGTMTPEGQATIETQAYMHALGDAFLQHNKVSRDVRSFIAKLERSHETSDKLKAFALNNIFKVLNVSANFFSAGLDYTPGVGHIRAQMMSRSKVEMTPERANRIARANKRSTVGAVMFALGYANPQIFGGYDKYDKENRGGVKAGEVKIGDYQLPHWLTHTPFLIPFQLGATAGNYAHSEGSDKDLTKYSMEAIKGVVETNPFAYTFQTFLGAMDSKKKFNQFVFDEAFGQWIPFSAAVRKVGEWNDMGEDGHAIKRVPNDNTIIQGFEDRMKIATGIGRKTVQSKDEAVDYQRKIDAQHKPKISAEAKQLSKEKLRQEHLKTEQYAKDTGQEYKNPDRSSKRPSRPHRPSR